MTVGTASSLEVRNLIGGAWAPGSSGESIDVIDPATGQVVNQLVDSTPDDVDRAVAAAREAQPAWGRLTPGQRSAVLHELAASAAAHLDELIDLEVTDAGKPVTAARDEEFPAIVDALRHFAGAGRAMGGQTAGEYVPGVTHMMRREPVGVVAGITPWNYPLWQAIWKIVPALATGNAVVIKPAENTPMSTTRFLQLAAELLPAGLVNLVHGLGRTAGAALSGHPDVDLVSFTGSTVTGRAIAQLAAGGPKRLLLELGGNSPVVVLDDADLDAAAATVAFAGLYNAGQECMAASRVIVSANRADAFTQRLLDVVGKVVLGDPRDQATTLGPMISERQIARALGMLERRPSGARVLTGGARLDRPGFYLQPTVVTGLDQADELVQDEIFAPVITIQTFRTDDEALGLANGVAQGLAGAVWTTDVDRAMRFSRDLSYGNVWVNSHLMIGADTPIGGFKASGYGTEGGVAGFEEFTRVKSVGIKLG